MKILHVIPAVAARYGGPSSSIAPMCRSLLQQGMEVLLAATDADGGSRLDVPIGSETVWQGVPAIFFSRTWSESYKYSHGLARWLSLHAGDFDVVHVHAVLSHAPLTAAAACRRAGVPYVVRPLGTLDPWSLRQKRLRKKILLALGGRRTLADAAAIQYTSAEEQRQTEGSLALNRGVVVPLGIDPKLLSEPVCAHERQRDPYVLVLSRLHPVKNLEALIEAFAGLTEGRRFNTPWRLVIAGGGRRDYAVALQQLVDKRGAHDRVSFPGWVDGEDKRQLVRGASLFALASFHENFGVSLVEALAAGVPALVSREVHLSEAVESASAGWVVGTDEASLRAGLAEAFGRGAEREAKGHAARGLADRFTWPRVGAQLAELYRRLSTCSADLQVRRVGQA